MRVVKSLVAVGIFVASLAAQAQQYQQYVVAEDVATQFVNGELRFCERANLKGIVCGFQQKLFGKRHFAARDWWSPETYVQARTGLNEFTLWKVEPTGDGRGVVIYFSP